MEQKKLVLTIENANGEVIFQKDPAGIQDVGAAIPLFAETASRFVIDVVTYELPKNDN